MPVLFDLSAAGLEWRQSGCIWTWYSEDPGPCRGGRSNGQCYHALELTGAGCLSVAVDSWAIWVRGWHYCDGVATLPSRRADRVAAGSPSFIFSPAIGRSPQGSWGNEAYLSAEPDPPEAEARLSVPHEDEWGSCRDQAASREGAETARRQHGLQVAMERWTGRLRRSDRLLRSRDFKRVNQLGERAASRHFVVLVSPRGTRPGRRTGSRGDGSQRLGITASRKVGNAVARNRVKRAVREWFRKERCELESDIDLVVIARREATQLSTGEVAEALRVLTRHAAGRGQE